MKIWKLGLTGIISACLISSSVVKAEQSPEEILNTHNSVISNIDDIIDDVLDNSNVWNELEDLSSNVSIQIDWQIPSRSEILREARVIKRYQNRHLKVVLRRGRKYIPLIKKIFKKYNIPDELVFLPVIESGFKIKAVSPSGAAGLWQFMPITAKEYGLRIDRWIDERYDVEKSTIAAARYLRDLHAYFGNWYIVLASYNVGKYAVSRRIRGRGNNFWMVKSRLPRAARKYTIKFLATIEVLKNLLRKEEFKETDVNFEIVKVRKNVTLKEIASITGVPLWKLRKLNPHLKKGTTPPYRGVFNIYVPKGYKHSVEVALNLKDLDIKLSKLDMIDEELDLDLRNIDYELNQLNLDNINLDNNSSQIFKVFRTNMIF
jgi:membrane-bound lytic murein transglycosylase D